jgi:hypothetical protein
VYGIQQYGTQAYATSLEASALLSTDQLMPEVAATVADTVDAAYVVSLLKC